MSHSKLALIGSTREELESFATAHDQPAYRGRQLYHWLYAKRASAVSEMSDLPALFRTVLEEETEAGSLTEVLRTPQEKDGTQKFLFELADGLRVETVYLPGSPGETVCLSCQVGCAIGCSFCATGQMGFFRNLTVGEMLLQVLEIERLKKTTATNVVFMGMGEPLHNYDHVVRALHLLADPNGFAIPASKITVSTVGIAPMIEQWCADNPPAKLALSLHATTDAMRQTVIPTAKAFDLDAVMKSLRKLAHTTRFPITIEYVLIAGFNDQWEDVLRLKGFLRNIPAKVNLIRLHPTNSAYRGSDEDAISQFMGWLVEEEISCTVRRSRGVNIAAACGMLFAEEPKRPE